MEWFLLWCQADTSYFLVKHTSVLYDGSVNVGDEVKFFFNSQECIGEIRGMSDGM